MTTLLHPDQDPARTAMRSATRDFADSLVRDDLLGHTVRLEATVFAAGEGSLFRIDRALAAGWPQGLGETPNHEVILVRAGGELQGLKLSAFDDRGRALLRRHYMADSAGRVRRLNAERKAGGHV